MRNKHIQKTKTALLVLLFSLTGMTSIFAQKFTVGKLEYITKGVNSVVVTGHVDGKKAHGKLIIPESVTITMDVFEITYPVTGIGSRAFEDCSGFTGNLTIPNSVTTIGDYAFSGCSGLTGSLTIPNSVTTIGDYAFFGCSGLTGSLTIPNSVTEIGMSAFYRCSGFNDNLTIPNSVTKIGDMAFFGCSNFTGSLTIPNSVTTINEYVFCNCSGFTGNLTVPNSVTTIGDYAFSGCSGLTGSLTIPNSVTKIGKNAFSGCSGFSGGVTIPKSVIKIDNKAFSGCKGFDGILIIESVNVEFGRDVFKGCNNLKIPQSNTVTSITQKLGNDNNKHKLYDGEFKMSGFEFNGDKYVNAKAAYYYYDAPDGTRIFDGPFCFYSNNLLNWSVVKRSSVFDSESIAYEDIENIYEENAVDGMCLALGKFSQDKQVGKWIWISKYQGSHSIHVCTIKFNESGVPEGDFEIYHLYKPITYSETNHYKAPNYYKRTYISGKIIDGVIVSIDSKEGYNTQIACNGVTHYISQISGRYNNDGYPIGQWSFSGSDYTDYGRNIVVAFDDEGKCIKNYRIDPTTGDKIGNSYEMAKQPIRIARDAINSISNRFFRSTRVQWRQNNIRKYEY